MGIKTIKGEINIPFRTSAVAEAVYEALGPEAGPQGAAVQPSCHIEGPTLTLDMASSEVSGMRASVNSYLRWIHSAEAIYMGCEI